MALDQSRLGLENKFLENKLGRPFFCVRQVYFTNSCQQIWGCVSQLFVLFIHHIWGETVLFIIQTSDRIRHFTIFQYSGRSSWAFNETVQKNSKIAYKKNGHSVHTFDCCVWMNTLIELRFNIIKNLLCLLFYLMDVRKS